MESLEVVSLRLVTQPTLVFANLQGEKRDLIIWVAAALADGKVRAGLEQSTGHPVRTTDGTIVLRVTLSANESVRAIPGDAGVMAMRITGV